VVGEPCVRVASSAPYYVLALFVQASSGALWSGHAGKGDSFVHQGVDVVRAVGCRVAAVTDR
jgi:hypothetical protein